MRPFACFIFFLSLVACGNPTKNTSTPVEVETGTALSEEITAITPNKTEPSTDNELAKLQGTWVGDFQKADNDGSMLVVDEGFVWDRTNKINISIDELDNGKAIGHSVVAGNNRPFEGDYKPAEGGGYAFVVREPGADQYDGAFSFIVKDGLLSGTWKAYKQIEISERKYELNKKTFTYNPTIMLERNTVYVDWKKSIENKEVFEGGGEVEEWVSMQFASATELIYKLNASNELLDKGMVENLKRGDLTIIRNTIYARHGYSFKDRPLRLFFDKQPWYIPIHADIRGDFTELEKQNIKLLLKYEKNAAEYYDSFGRG